MHSRIKLVFIECCFDGLNGILSNFFFFWLTFLKGDALLWSLSQKHMKNFCNGLHCANQRLDQVDRGVFERFAKVGKVVGRFYNSNGHIF